jgi:AAA15 family ATPase/GTPase
MALNSFGIKNFRNIDELTNIEFGDVNIFIGPNSSGKSSLLKGLLMSNQVCKMESCNAVINRILRNPDADFGLFDGASKLSDRIVLSRRVLNYEVQFEYALDSFGVASIFYFKIMDDNGELIFGINGNRVLQLNIDFFQNRISGVYPGRINISELNNIFKFDNYETEENVWEKIKLEFKTGVELRTQTYDLLETLQMIQNYGKALGSVFLGEEFTLKVFGNRIDIEEWRKMIVEGELICFSNDFHVEISKFVSKIILSIGEECRNFDHNHIYLSPNRYFSYAGETRPVSAFRVSLAEDLRYFLNRNLDLNDSFKFYYKWLNLFELPILKGCSNLTDEEYLFELVRLLETNSIMPAGYGLTQLLPIILSSGLFNSTYSAKKSYYKFEGQDFTNSKSNAEYAQERLYRGRSILVEEPEANLHPNFQSKLAEMICESCHLFENTFYVETHSEYLIRKFQYLKAKGELKDLSIKIFNFKGKSDSTHQRFEWKEIKLNDDGSLSEQFYPGFFDEADNIAFQLYKLNNARFN